MASGRSHTSQVSEDVKGQTHQTSAATSGAAHAQTQVFVAPPPPPPLPSTLRTLQSPGSNHEAPPQAGPFIRARPPNPTNPNSTSNVSVYESYIPSLSQSSPYTPADSSSTRPRYSPSAYQPNSASPFVPQAPQIHSARPITSFSGTPLPSYASYKPASQPPVYNQPIRSQSIPQSVSSPAAYASTSGSPYNSTSTPYNSTSASPYNATSTSYHPSSGRQPKKKVDAFVANDPFHTANTKVEKISDDLTFDDIPTAGARPSTSYRPATPYESPAPTNYTSPSPFHSGPYRPSPSGPSLYGASPGRPSSSSYPQTVGNSSQSPYTPQTSSQVYPPSAMSVPAYSSYSNANAPASSHSTSAPTNQAAVPTPAYDSQHTYPHVPITNQPAQQHNPAPSSQSTAYEPAFPPSRSDTLATPQHVVQASPSSPEMHNTTGGTASQQPMSVGASATPEPQAPIASGLAPPYSYPSPFDGRAETTPATGPSGWQTPSVYHPDTAYSYPPFPRPLSPISEQRPTYSKPSMWARAMNVLLPWRRMKKGNTYSLTPLWDDDDLPSTKVALRLVISTIPRQVYLHLLLRLPALYFGRVARIFEEADLTLPELKKMALETASEGKFDIHMMEASTVPPQYEKLKVTWEGFIDSVMREWKTFNIISVLLLSAILTILQIDAAAADPVTRYAALFSLICALMSLLFGCMYIIRFGGMRKTYKAAEWALEAKKTKTIIWWNVWVLLAMPVVWLTWSIVLYLVCIMSFIWRTSSADTAPPQPLSPGGLLAVRIVLTVVLGLGVVYSALIILTFRRYGEAMDRQWKDRIDGWLEEKSLHVPFYHSASGYNGAPESQPSHSYYRPPPPPPQPLQRAPSYADHGYGYSYSADVKSRYGDLGVPAYSSIPLKDPFNRPGTPDSTDTNTHLTQSNTYYNKTAINPPNPWAGRGSPVSEFPEHPTVIHVPPSPPSRMPSPLLPTPEPAKAPQKLVVPPPPVSSIPSTPLTPVRRTPDGSIGTFDNEESPHVHFRSPLASGSTGGSPWSYSERRLGPGPSEAGPSSPSALIDLSRKTSTKSSDSFDPYKLIDSGK